MNARQRRQRARRHLRGVGAGPTLAEMVREQPWTPAAKPAPAPLTIVREPEVQYPEPLVVSAFDDFLPAAPPRDAAWPEPLPPVLSPTSITTFLTCPEQWRRVYLVGERSRCSSALLIGRVDSKAREIDLGQKIHTGINMPLEAVKDAAATAWDEELEKEGGVGEIEWDAGEKPGGVKDLSIAVASAYRTQRAEQVFPVGVEERVEWARPTVPFTIAGYVDVRESPRIREAKTSKKRQSKPSNGWLAQAAIYTAASKLPAVFDVTVKNARPEVLPELEGYGVAAAQRKTEAFGVSVAEGILALLEKIGPDRHWPGTASTQLLSACGWCDLRASCPFAP